MHDDAVDGAKPTPVSRSFHDHPVTAIPFEGGIVFIVVEVEAALDLKPWQLSKQLARWEGAGLVRDGTHFLKLANGRLAAFRKGMHFTKCEVDPKASHLLVLTERGLYRVLQLSRSPIALAFQDWLEEEVLPEIRRTGGYRSGDSPALTSSTAPPPAPPPRPRPPSPPARRRPVPPSAVRVLRALLTRMQNRMEPAAYEALDVALHEVEQLPDPFDGLDAIDPGIGDVPEDEMRHPKRMALMLSLTSYATILRTSDLARLLRWAHVRPAIEGVFSPTPKALTGPKKGS